MVRVITVEAPCCPCQEPSLSGVYFIHCYCTLVEEESQAWQRPVITCWHQSTTTS
jgi:hypothetical protein